MPDKIRKAPYYCIEVPHTSGQGAKILSALKEAGVNLLAFSGFPLGGGGSGGRAQLDFVPENPDAFVQAMKAQDVKLSEKKNAFLVQGDDRPGAAVEILGKLGAQGISVTAAQAVTAGERRWGMILWVSPTDYAKASKALGV
jgi:hypothetical protein